MSGGAESVGRCIDVQRNQEAPRGGQQPGGLPGNGRSWSRRRTGAALGRRPTGGWQTAAVVAVYSTQPSRWRQAPAGKTASTMTIWKVRITDWPVASNVASTSTE